MEKELHLLLSYWIMSLSLPCYYLIFFLWQTHTTYDNNI